MQASDVDEGCWGRCQELLRQEEALYLAVTARHYDPDEDGRRLTARLLQTMAYKPPFFLSPGGLAALSRRAVGPPMADALGLPDPPTWARSLDALARANRRMQRLRDRSPAVRTATLWLGERIVVATQRVGLARPTNYTLPRSDPDATA